MPIITVFSTFEEWVAGVADYVTKSALDAIEQRGRFTTVFSGGTTPQHIYERLAASPHRDLIDWSRVHIFLGDERCVPPDDEQSNYRMICEALTNHVSIPPEQVYRIRGEVPPEQAADEYALELEKLFGGSAAAGGPPRQGFDLSLMGLGENGHTASLFPGLAAVTETKKWVMAQYVEVVGMWRVTLTPPVFNAALDTAFLVEGEAKADIVRRIVDGSRDPIVLPSQVILPDNGVLRWLLDASAAAKLSPDIRGN